MSELDALRAQLEQARELYVAMLAELNDLRAENRRLRAERDDAIDAEKIALREIGAENRRLRAELALAEHMLKNHIHLADNSQAAQAAPSPAADP